MTKLQDKINRLNKSKVFRIIKFYYKYKLKLSLLIYKLTGKEMFLK